MESKPSVRDILILVLLALAPSLILGRVVAEIAPRDPDNELTFLAATASWDNYLKMRPEWRPRVLSNLSAKFAADLTGATQHPPQKAVRRATFLHCSAWLIFINLLLIAAFGRRALPFIWGTFAAVMFGYASGLDARVYPWDLPGTFVFTVFVVLHARGWHRAMPFLIAGGALFKETTVVLCVTPLFLTDLPWKTRLQRAAISVALFAAMKIGVDLLVGNPIPFFSMTPDPPGAESSRVMNNLRGALKPRLMLPLFINAGTLVAMFLLPNRDTTARMFKCIALIFALNLLIFGRILEYRIWFEMTPLAIFALLQHFELLPLCSTATSMDSGAAAPKS